MTSVTGSCRWGSSHTDEAKGGGASSRGADGGGVGGGWSTQDLDVHSIWLAAVCSS